MRTTVNIDDELLAAVKVLAASQHRTIGSVLEESLRRHLASADGAQSRSVTLPDFGYRDGLQPGVDLYDKEAMAALLGEASR